MEQEVTYVLERELNSLRQFFETCLTPGVHWVPPSTEQLLEWHRQPGVIARKIVQDGFIVACLFVQRRRYVCRTLALGVSPNYRRKGLASLLYDRIKKTSCRGLTVRVHERSLDAQLFFRALGFKTREMVLADNDDISDDSLEDRDIILYKEFNRARSASM